ncbi:SPOR domain-containing protein [Siculibacillus lacustris]|uniref:SPOR domain-containing protein n=1 Tax=Siculibacillus lacustris TaxID=1549641 RepID=A0A4Q9VQZ2_9HYPH|nr:SPOR domain-containing protein [Siculibacillus lacustris]TBW37991.1 SPOR domain-containing protein [Siculibacillus lacustris]
MSEPMRQPPVDPSAIQGGALRDAGLRPGRPMSEDPLEELARILGESSAHPVRPESVVEVGRRATPTLPMPLQLSALEAELFDELRSSVTPEARVRGTFAPEVRPIMPQHPADDHDIAALRITPERGDTAPPAVPQPIAGAEPPHETPWNDYYAYDEGVAAGSYDPALVSAPQPREGASRDPAAMPLDDGPRPTFDEFGRAEIARAADEARPYTTTEPVITPHPRREQRAVRKLAKRSSGLGTRLFVATLGLAVLGGGAWAGWKYFGPGAGSAPTLIRADGKPMKVVPEPGKAIAAGDARPTLTPDSGAGASKIVSMQEDPVDQVSGRTPEGKEVRVINPGAPRAGSDQPHTVKTVVVRPDGSIVSDAGTVRPPTPVRTLPIGADGATPPPVSAVPPSPPAAAEPPLQLQLPPEASAAPRPIAVPLPTDAPTSTRVATPPKAAVAPAPVTPPPAAAPKPATAPAPTVLAVPKPTVPAPTPTAAPAARAPAGAPLALGPVGPRLANAPAAPAPVAAAPVPLAPAVASAPPAAAGSGEWMVQISASKSDADARRSFADAQRRWSALSGRSVDVQQANLGDKGVFYRTRVSAGTRDQATALCEQLRAQGGQCMVVKR